MVKTISPHIQDSVRPYRQQIFKGLWEHYFRLVPFASQMDAAFKLRGDHWLEDHVAFRTLPGPHTGSPILQGVFEALGYTRRDDYHFADKKLRAFWLAPPDIDGHTRDSSPKIFVSELEAQHFSPAFQKIVSHYTAQVVASPLSRIKSLSEQARGGSAEAGQKLVTECVKLLTSPPAWSRPTAADFDLLSKESEYASWTLLFGPQINHFTVSAHLMKTFEGIHQIADFIENQLNIPMNKVGGVVKGTPELLLEQIATNAVKVDFPFQDGARTVPYGFVEYAFRYPLPGHKSDGHWHSYYQGFVTSNADKIFESTFQSGAK
jgi:hypothetical protein